MGRLQTIPQGNPDHLQAPSSDHPDHLQATTSSDDPTASTTAAVLFPPAPHSHTTTSHLAHSTHHIIHQETSMPNNSDLQSPTADTSCTVSSNPLPGSTYHHVPPGTSRVDNDIDSITAVAFPPPSGDIHAPPPNNQLVLYVPQAPRQHDGSDAIHGVPVGQIPATGSTSRHQSQFDEDIDSIPAVAFPPQPRQHDGSAGDHGVHVGQIPATGTMRHQSPGGQVPTMVSMRQQSSQAGRIPLVLVQGVGHPWSSGLFDCFQHPTNAIITTLAPCVTFGQIAEVVDNGSTSCVTGAMLYLFLFLVICHWNIGVRYRQRLRNAFEIAETPVTDRIAHVMFPLCALCQEFRELKNQGYDPSLGYQGIIAKIYHEQKQQEWETYPPMSQIMVR